VSARAFVVGFYVVAGLGFTVDHGNVDKGWGLHPLCICLLFGDVGWVGVGFTGLSYLLEYWPEVVEVLVGGDLDLHVHRLDRWLRLYRG
jgi:hypothetical protein